MSYKRFKSGYTDYNYYVYGTTDLDEAKWYSQEGVELFLFYDGENIYHIPTGLRDDIKAFDDENHSGYTPKKYFNLIDSGNQHIALIYDGFIEIYITYSYGGFIVDNVHTWGKHNEWGYRIDKIEIKSINDKGLYKPLVLGFYYCRYYNSGNYDMKEKTLSKYTITIPKGTYSISPSIQLSSADYDPTSSKYSGDMFYLYMSFDAKYVYDETDSDWYRGMTGNYFPYSSLKTDTGKTYFPQFTWK